MAYTPINWQTGDTITAEKMNKMDNGWSADSTQLFSETVTTVSSEYGNEGELTYTSSVTASAIKVLFNNVEYMCPVVVMSDGKGYGGVTAGWSYDFSVYPFALVFSNSDGNFLATESAGTYSVEVSEVAIEVSSQFVSAVNASIPELISLSPFKLVADETTMSEFNVAWQQKSFCYLWGGANQYIVNGTGTPSAGKTPLIVYPTPANGSFAFDSNGILRFYNE